MQDSSAIHGSFHGVLMSGQKIDRRALLLGVAALLLAPGEVFAAKKKKTTKKKAATKKPFKLDPIYEPQRVMFRGYAPGTVVVDPGNRFLYYIEDPSYARRYGIGVGRSGWGLRGAAVVGRKAEWPGWRPTDAMIRRSPQKYARYAGGMPGGPRNPLGARALYLFREGKDTMYRIHGTTEPWTIGQAVSNGCIRMVNDHVIDLYGRVPVGAAVMIV
jgi:lipoprotein-anchoring transpeptidase ErfK/SrfK